MVAKEEILSDGDITLQTGYRLTGAGLHYGLPIAAFSLVFAVNNNLSLYSVLGPTTSPGDSRSPRNRIKIIEALASNEKTTTEFFRESLLDNQSVRNHLIQLRKIGILDFDSSQRLRRRLAVNLTPVGRDFFENYISPIKKALVVGRQLDEMNRRYLMLLMQNPETFTKIAQKATRIYASISPNIRRVDQDKRMEQIYRLLEEKGKMTRRQVAEELRIALNLTTRYLRMMRKSQIIQFEVSECEEKIYSLRSRP
jgi:predicted HTH transcriptional regulator